MMSRGTRAVPGLPGRGGFTLIELMVVITIIILLIGISGATYILVMRTQKGKNTDTLIQKLNQSLQVQIRAYRDAVKTADVPSQYVTQAYNLGFGGDLTKARELWLNDTSQVVLNSQGQGPLFYEFPQTFLVAWSNPRYQQMMKAAGLTGPPSSPRPTESCECLLLALMANRGGTAFKTEDLPSGTLADTDGDGLKELLDAWGSPLNFSWQSVNGDLQPVITTPNTQ
jgi:prepilin-type N-terminal cleavage/methylation domain-containing protein